MCLQWFWQPYHNEIHDTYESVLNDPEPHMRNPCKNEHYHKRTESKTTTTKIKSCRCIKCDALAQFAIDFVSVFKKKKWYGDIDG